MNTRPLQLTYASTDTVDAKDRLAYWDYYNANALIGLTTSSHSTAGLKARQTNVSLDHMRIAMIEANHHVIERSPALVRQYPKDAVFACHLVSGSAYFKQNGKEFVLNASDTIVYDTCLPFTFGFLSDMRELLVDIPLSVVTEQWDIQPDELPLKICLVSGIGATLGTEFRRLLGGYLRSPTDEVAESLPERTHVLLRSMVMSSKDESHAMDRSVFYVIDAKGYIAQNLRNPDLRASAVAEKVGVSVRHLNRLFAKEQTSLVEYIWTQRTSRAHRDLLANKSRNVTIGEIAYRWGFSSQAHFCRTIVARYGMTPSDVLRA